MPAYQAVIFDLDGLLIDTERLAVDTGIAAFGALGHGITRDIMCELVGVDADAGFRMICERLGQTVDRAALDREWMAAMDRATASGVPLRPGVAAVLGRMDRQGIARAVATNSGTAHALDKIGRAGLATALKVVVGFDSVKLPKPAPDVYLEAARRLGADPRHCLAFDDSDTGVRAALAAGMTVVQVPDMIPSREMRAHHLAESLEAGAALAGLWR